MWSEFYSFVFLFFILVLVLTRSVGRYRLALCQQEGVSSCVVFVTEVVSGGDSKGKWLEVQSTMILSHAIPQPKN